MTSPEPPTAPAYELPGALAVVSRGFDLIVAASGQIRGASVYIGLLLLAVFAPAGILGGALALTAPDDLLTMAEEIEAWAAAMEGGALVEGPEAGWFGVVLLFACLMLAALLAFVAISMEAQIIGIAILGGHLAGRPLSLREAVIRSRQTFWRVVRAAILVAIPVGLIQQAVAAALGGQQLADEGAALIVTFVGTVVGAPFVYAPSGIVLGDVGAREALGRSINLARARWRLALMVALFPAVFSSVQILALGAGGDVVARVGAALGLGFDADAGRALLTVAFILFFIAALGSLIFTMSAVLAAPQVVAFVGLTHYVAGLDLARMPELPPLPEGPPASVVSSIGHGFPLLNAQAAPPSAAGSPGWSGWGASASFVRFRWITRPMVAGIIGMTMLAIFGVIMLGGVAGT